MIVNGRGLDSNLISLFQMTVFETTRPAVLPTFSKKQKQMFSLLSDFLLCSCINQGHLNYLFLYLVLKSIGQYDNPIKFSEYFTSMKFAVQKFNK